MRLQNYFLDFSLPPTQIVKNRENPKKSTIITNLSWLIMTDRLSKLQNYFSEGFLFFVSFLNFLHNALFDKMRIEKVFLGIVINTELLIRQLFSNFLLKPYSSFWSAWKALSDDTNFNILYVHRKNSIFSNSSSEPPPSWSRYVTNMHERIV